jgi:DNA-binding CsgD family transcriptional regulator
MFKHVPGHRAVSIGSKHAAFRPSLPRTDDAIAGLYQSALDPTAWRPALDGIARLVGADAFHMFTCDAATSVPRLSLVSHDSYESVIRGYETRYTAIDVVREKALELGPGPFFATQRHFTDAEVARSQWFQEFLIPNGMCWVLGGIFPAPQGTFSVLALLRSADRGRYAEAELEVGRRAWTHYSRATALFVQAESLRRAAALGHAGLDEMDLGVMAVERAGRVVHANATAIALLDRSRALGLRLQSLVAADPCEQTILLSALHAAADRGMGSSVPLGNTLPDAERLYASVTLLPESSRIWRLFERPAVLVLLRQRDRGRYPSEQQLMQLFGMTPAEARLARGLVHGLAPEECAAEAGVTIHTVRTQQRRICEKTGVTRAPDFVRLIGSIAAVRNRR